MSVLTVSNVSKSFGSARALDGASFELAQGELLALLGPNGAGMMFREPSSSRSSRPSMKAVGTLRSACKLPA
jgi:ABC-type enterochelin transport system ATPase subunit